MSRVRLLLLASCGALTGCLAPPTIPELGYRGETELLASLLDEPGVSVDEVDEHGGTALYYAAHRGHLATVKMLLARGADADRRTTENSQPLEVAIDAGYVSVAALLIEHGVEVNVQSARYGRSPLMLACMRAQRDIVRALLEAGADTSPRDHDGAPALFDAAQSGDPEILRMILAAGSDPNDSARTDGITPLMAAADGGWEEGVRLLLAAGADRTARSGAGRDAASYASKHGNARLTALLEGAAGG